MSRLVLVSCVTLGLLVGGFYFLVATLIRKRKTGCVHQDQEENLAPWSAEEGYGIIVRAVCCGTLLYFIFPMLGGDLKLLYIWNALVLWGRQRGGFIGVYPSQAEKNLRSFLG